jgi:hypothetical protein
MDARAFTKLLVKIAGLFALFYVIATVPSYLSLIPTLIRESAPWWAYLTGVVAPIVFSLGLALALLLLPGTITNAVVQDAAAPAESPVFDIARVEEGAVALLAIYLFFRALSDAAYWIARLKLYYLMVDSRSIVPAPAPIPGDFAGIVATGLELVLAVALFFGARGLVRLKNKIRGRG